MVPPEKNVASKNWSSNEGSTSMMAFPPFLAAGKPKIFPMFKTLMTFHYMDWSIGILVLAYHNPLYNPTNQGFGHCACPTLNKNAIRF